MRRISDPDEFRALVEMNAPPRQLLADFDAAEWIADPHIIALRIDNDLAIFENWWPGMARGHIWFQSRGLKAFRRARQMLDHVASNGLTEILGAVPVWRKDVQRFVTGLGFQAIGAKSTNNGGVIVYSRIANRSPA